MKKFFAHCSLALAALMACAGAAQAQSSVQLQGLVDLSVARIGAPGQLSKTTVENGAMTTSYWIIRGKEDLGSGLSAIFSLESFFRADTGEAGRSLPPGRTDTLFSRSAYVGLDSTALGSVRLGRITTPLFVSTVTFNAFGDSYGFSPSVRHVFTSGTVSGDSGWNDALAYSTPSMGGLKLNVVAAAGEKVGGNNTSASAVYERGAFAATAVFQNVKKDFQNDTADTRTWQAGAAYDFGLAKVFAQYTKVENKTTNKDYKLTDLSAAIPVTAAGKVLVAYGLLNRVDNPNDRKTFSLAYDHYLSKRTDAYVTAMRDKDESAATRQGATSYAVGIRHRF